MNLPQGLYDQLIDSALRQQLTNIDSALYSETALDSGDSAGVLTQYVATQVQRILDNTGRGKSGMDKVRSQLELCNSLLTVVNSHANSGPKTKTQAEQIDKSASKLRHIVTANQTPPPQPAIPLARSALLMNGVDQPRIGEELKMEIQSADEIVLLCAFVRWTGLRLVLDELRGAIDRGVKLRVITTTYTGATEKRAVDTLVDIGADVRICYETRSTRLHAKAWLFNRHSGYSTAYIGSSNLSRSALVDGLEWNVRLAAAEHGHLLDLFQATFDQYWEEPEFEVYSPENNGNQLELALKSQVNGNNEAAILPSIDVRPYPFQQEMLDDLDTARRLHGRYRNLVVAATGTGKTILAALDYRRLNSQGEVKTLLFVAHREEILKQSAATFRLVMKQSDFGELLVGGTRPSQWTAVFASIQSLRESTLSELDPALFDMVIVDEFHHAAAKSYEHLLGTLTPRYLLGLTATPERTDGQDITYWFDGYIDAELRLREALERDLLCPFQYFGINDDIDLSGVRWRRGGYDITELSNVYSGDDVRAQRIYHAVADKVLNPLSMKALGFCVSVEHAEFMARKFRDFGITSIAISARTDRSTRQQSLRKLTQGNIQCIFCVDLFNEGVDIPDIDTVLFLRPTESATVFLQQLGRGLRRSPNKGLPYCFGFYWTAKPSFPF